LESITSDTDKLTPLQLTEGQRFMRILAMGESKKLLIIQIVYRQYYFLFATKAAHGAIA
jgi:hypothetical protein